MRSSGNEKNRKKTTQVLVLLEPEEVSHAARRAKPNYFDLVLGHDAAAVAKANAELQRLDDPAASREAHLSTRGALTPKHCSD